MKLFLLCSSLTAVFFFHIADASLFRFRRQDAAPAAAGRKCFACVGSDCSDKEDPCKAIFAPANEIMKAVSDAIVAALGEVTPEKLTECVTVNLDSDDGKKEVFRSCSIEGACDKLPAATPVGTYKIGTCTACKEDLCNGGGAATPSGGASEAESEGPAETTTVMDNSSAYTFKQGQGSSFYWMWMVAVVLLASLFA